MIRNLSRRELLRLGLVAVGAGGIGLAVGHWLGERRERWRKRAPERPNALSPSALVAVWPDETISIWLNKTEVGQGVSTALPQILADELDADWARIKVELPWASRDFGEQLTAVSASIKREFDEHRLVGAITRQLLVAAAALELGVAADTLETERGVVHHRASGRSKTYGALVATARTLPVPKTAPLKDPARFTLIGKPLPRLDGPAKVTGRARYTFDLHLDGMVVAALARPPDVRPGAPLHDVEPAALDDRAARAVPGVVGVERTRVGVAVIAEDTWAALSGAEALAVTWPPGPHAALDDAAIDRALVDALADGGRSVRAGGDVDAALAGAATRVEATYTLPYLAHLNLEPPCAIAHVEPAGRSPRCTVWAPTQTPVGTQEHVARLLGVSPGEVVVYPQPAGSAFGRRVEQDVVTEAVVVSMRVGRPVKLVWSRADDLRHDVFRPVSRHVLAAGLDARGALVAWRHATSAPSILHQKSGSMFDPTTVEGLREVPYVGEGADAPAHALTYHRADLPTPLGFWRSVGHSQNALAIECFVDELAEAAAVDPVALRRRLLGARHPRHLGVLDRAAAEVAAIGAGDASRVWGWALHASFDSYVALAARCARDGERLRVEHVVAAVDCGRVVNPNVVRQQIEGGVCFGLSAALYGRVRIQGGAVVERGFHDHPVLRFDAAPTIDVHLVASEAPPTGVGEIAVPLIGPAVVNAWSRLLGRRVRSLPLFPSG